MRPFTPEIAKLPAANVLTVTTIGDPNKDAAEGVGALYGTAYGTKFKVFKPKKKVMEIGQFSAFWPDAHVKPKAKWTGNWNLGVSSFVKQSDLVQKNPKITIKLAKRKAATIAQILHIGSYATEGPTIEKLHDFVKEKGYILAGPHEEVYLTKPDAKVVKTIIRYVIKKRGL